MMNMRTHELRGSVQAGGWLHLAATPVFAAMALISAGAADDSARMFCQTTSHAALSLGGMTVMYLLMAVFHAVPWWKWIARRLRSHMRVKKTCTPETAAVETR